MVTAYILITSKSGEERTIVQRLQEIDEIETADLLYGEYDIIVKVNISEIEKLGGFIIEHIRPIEGIERTSTLIVAS